jgi:hypothetical protein
MFPWELNDGSTTKKMELELGFGSKTDLSPSLGFFFSKPTHIQNYEFELGFLLGNIQAKIQVQT